MKPKDRYAKFARDFQRVRLSHGLSFRDVAKRTRIHYSTIHRFEHRKKVDVFHCIALTDWTVENTTH